MTHYVLSTEFVPAYGPEMPPMVLFIVSCDVDGRDGAGVVDFSNDERKAMKFSDLPQICGGPIEIAVITSDRRFRWVKHKTWDAAIMEG